MSLQIIVIMANAVIYDSIFWQENLFNSWRAATKKPVGRAFKTPGLNHKQIFLTSFHWSASARIKLCSQHSLFSIRLYSFQINHKVKLFSAGWWSLWRTSGYAPQDDDVTSARFVSSCSNGGPAIFSTHDAKLSGCTRWVRVPCYIPTNARWILNNLSWLVS